MREVNPNIDPIKSHNGAQNKCSPWRKKTYKFYGKAAKKQLGVAEFEGEKAR